MRNLRWSLPHAIAAATLVASTLFAMPSYAATDTQYKYTAPKTGHFSIGTGAMTPASVGAFNSYLVSDGTLIADTGSDKCFNAGVNVPSGAKITGFAIFYKSGANTFTVQLQRYRFNDGGATVIANKTITDVTNIRKSLLLPVNANDAVRTVSNVQFNYVFSVCLNHIAQQFYGARITYTYTNAGD